MRLAALLLLALPATAQPGFIATDYFGRVVLFVSTARVAGEGAGSSQRVVAFAGCETKVIAGSPPSQLGPSASGVSALFVNDHGDLQAHSFWVRSPRGPFDFTGQIDSAGVIRHVRDGWEVSKAGRAILSRDGRWAAFTGDRVLVDLWSGEQTSLPDEAAGITTLADDGSLVMPAPKSLRVCRPGAAQSQISLPFMPQTTAIDRTGRHAAVYGERAAQGRSGCPAKDLWWIQPL